MKIYKNIEQGSKEWFDVRLGIITASNASKILTSTNKIADNDTMRDYMYELVAEIYTGKPRESFKSEYMDKGTNDETDARASYSQRHDIVVNEVGFITNDFDCGTIGYSPDGMIGDDGLVELKCKMSKFHVKVIIFNEIPKEYMHQLQTGLLVTGRKWIDFVMRCDGLPDFEKRVYPDLELHETIKIAVAQFYNKMELIKQQLIGTKK